MFERVNPDRLLIPTPKNIETFEQNNPQLVVNDLREFINPRLVTDSLLRRGVNKWLRVRRLLIQLKHRWKQEIDDLFIKATQEKAAGKYARAYRTLGERTATIRHRQQVRALCHSPRFFIWYMLDIDDVCLPEEFPDQPNKRWFKQFDEVTSNGKQI